MKELMCGLLVLCILVACLLYGLSIKDDSISKIECINSLSFINNKGTYTQILNEKGFGVSCSTQKSEGK